MKYITLTLLFLCLSFTQIVKEANANELRVMAHRIPPFSMHDNNGNVTGFSADLFQIIHQKIENTAEKAQITPVTFNRLYTELSNAKRRIGLVVGRNSKREKLFQWVGPYLTIHLGVVAKKEKRFKINLISDFNGHKIATIQNTAPEQALLKMGIPVKGVSQDLYPQKIIQKLQSGRVNFMAYPLQSTSYLMNENNIQASDYEEVFPLRQIQLYFAFSKDFSASEISSYQNALDDVLASDTFQALKDKYTLDGISKYISPK